MGNTVPFGLLPRFGIDSRSVIVMPHQYGFTCYNTSEANVQLAENPGSTASAVTRVLPIFPSHRYDAYASYLNEWVDEREFSGTISTVNALLANTHPQPLCTSACCMECIILGCCGDTCRDQLLTYPLLAERFLLQFSHDRNAKRPPDQHVVWSLKPLVPGRGMSQHTRQYPLVYLNIRLPVPSNQFVVSTHPTGTRPHTNLDGSVTLIPTHSEFTAAGVNAGAAATAGPPQTPIMNRTLSPAAVMPMSLPPTPQHTADANSTQPLPQWQTHPPPQSHSTPQKSQTHTSFLSTVNSSAATAAAGGAGGGDTTGPRYVRQNLLTQTATSQATGTQFTFTAANDMKSAAEAAQFCSRCGTGRKDVHAQYCQKCGAPL